MRLWIMPSNFVLGGFSIRRSQRTIPQKVPENPFMQCHLGRGADFDRNRSVLII